MKCLFLYLDCTYNHFEHSSECPKCGRILNEQDFTELVVSNNGASGTDIVKSSLQSLFARQRGGSNGANTLPFSDLCFGVIRQIDAVKQSTKFLLKQLLMETSMSHKRYLQGRAVQSKMKEEMTRLKQENQSQKLQYEQVHADLRRKLQAREQDISDLQGKVAKKDKQLDQFRQLHSAATMDRGASSHRNSHNGNIIPPSSSQSMQREPPLRAIMKQKEANEQHQMQLLQQGASSSHRIGSSVGGSSAQGLGVSRHHNPSVLSSLMQRQHHQQQYQQQQNLRRPFSGASASSGSGLPSTPRIRDLSSASGYTFTATASNSGGHGINKRMRMSTPTGMSPNTAFAHNTSTQQPWSAGSGTAFARRR